MAIPDYDMLMFPVLKLLGDGLERSAVDITETLANELKLTEEERTRIYPNNPKRIFQDRVAWARTYLKKAGLIDSPQRSTSKITDIGKKVLIKNPKMIDNKFLTQVESFREFKKINIKTEKSENEEIVEDNKTPREIISNTSAILNRSLENDLLTMVLKKSPSFFEELVAKLLIKMGYGGSYEDILQNRGQSGDEGIDGIIKQDALGLDKIYIQAKKWADNSVSGPEIQKFVGAIRQKQATKGIFITTSRFTDAALKCAKEVSDTIILIDGKKLTKLMLDYNVGVQTEEIIEIKKMDEDFFEE